MSSERARDPDTPIDELFALVDRFPDEVLGNPAMDVLSMADPRRWKELVGHARWAKLAPALQTLVRSLPSGCERKVAALLIERALEQAGEGRLTGVYREVESGLAILRDALEHRASAARAAREKAPHLRLWSMLQRPAPDGSTRCLKLLSDALGDGDLDLEAMLDSCAQLAAERAETQGHVSTFARAEERAWQLEAIAAARQRGQL